MTEALIHGSTEIIMLVLIYSKSWCYCHTHSSLPTNIPGHPWKLLECSGCSVCLRVNPSHVTFLTTHQDCLDIFAVLKKTIIYFRESVSMVRGRGRGEEEQS